MSGHVLEREEERDPEPSTACGPDRVNVFCPFLPLTVGETPMVSWFCLGDKTKLQAPFGSLSFGQEALLKRWCHSSKPHGREGWHLPPHSLLSEGQMPWS